MLRVAIFGSTEGTDLGGIISSKKLGYLDEIDIVFVMSNKENSHILDRVYENGIKSIYMNPEGLTQEKYDSELSDLLKDQNIDLVLLLGYMKILSKHFIRKWYGRIINIHPSLLPAFADKTDINVHSAVLDRGCKFTGASLIYIDYCINTGPIISQEVVSVASDDTVETLRLKVQQAEIRLVVKGMNDFFTGSIPIPAPLESPHGSPSELMGQ